jgi:class 3 adenylate cyclase
MATTVLDWLEELGFGRYSEAFAENNIDFDLLADLNDGDLEKLGGASLGPRKLLLRAIAELGADAAVAPSDKAPAAERRQLTVMFCDLVGSTKLSRALDPEDLRDVMRRYQDAVAGAVARYNGHIAKFLGGGVLAYLGWPQAHEDQVERAVRAGVDAVAQRLKQLIRQF